MSDGSRERDRPVDVEGLLAALSNPALVVAGDDAIVSVNDAFCCSFGVESDHTAGRSLDRVTGVPDAVVGAVAERIADARSGGPTGPVETAVRSDDGAFSTFEVDAGILDADGGRALVVVRDVTGRDDREGPLTDGERTLRAVFEGTSDALLIANDDGDYVDANSAACDLFGHDRAALLGRNVSEFASAGYDASTAWDRFLAEGAMTGEFELVRSDGDARTVEFSATADVTPGRHLATLRDVTDRRRIEADLLESEVRFRQIVARVDETIWMADAETADLLYVSPGIETLTGRSPAYFVDDPIWNFVADVHPEDAPAARAAVEAWLTDVESGDPDDEYQFQFRYVRSDDAVAWLHVDASVVTDAAGRPDRIVGIIDDVTEMKRRERELERKNERLEEFAGMVRHDLRNPLQVVVGRVALLREAGVEPESVADIERAADRMAQLIDDLLTLARDGSDADVADAVSLELVASQAWGTVASADASFAVVDRAVVTADEGRLRQLFENLFRNAVEHAGPAVALEVGVVREDGVTTGFYVADDGPGIPPANRDRAFEPGYSTATDGTGFGLDIVAVVAEAHGWSVAITESQAGGARFEFTDVDVA